MLPKHFPRLAYDSERFFFFVLMPKITTLNRFNSSIILHMLAFIGKMHSNRYSGKWREEERKKRPLNRHNQSIANESNIECARMSVILNLSADNMREARGNARAMLTHVLPLCTQTTITLYLGYELYCKCGLFRHHRHFLCDYSITVLPFKVVDYVVNGNRSTKRSENSKNNWSTFSRFFALCYYFWLLCSIWPIPEPRYMAIGGERMAKRAF